MWKNIEINTNQIEHDTGRASLIKCPNKSCYKGYMFWHPSKLIRSGKHSASVSLGYTEEFTFTLKKYGNGKHNKSEVLDEVIINYEEFEDMFDETNNNIRAKEIDTESFLEINEPTKIEVENVEVNSCLTRNN